MIFVLLGTQDKPFDRLIKQVGKEIKKGNIKEKVIAQMGCTSFTCDKIEMFDFANKEEIDKITDEASIIITHAGVGTITDCLRKNKKVIVVPRLKKYGEHTNDHQMQITKEFAEKNYILPLYDVKKLSNALEKIKTFKPDKYESNGEKFRESIKNYINNL